MKIKANLQNSTSSLVGETLAALTKAEEQIVEKAAKQLKQQKKEQKYSDRLAS